MRRRTERPPLDPLQRCAAWLLAACALAGVAAPAAAQGPTAPQRAIDVPPQRAIDASPQRAIDAALERQRDADTLRGLTAEGQLLYQRERVKLDGYQYCSQSVTAAERGDFRASIDAASKALHIAQANHNDDLAALSKRDLAIAYSYAGDLANASKYALEALRHKAKNPQIVVAPVYKVLGDVAVREGKFDKAIEHYQQAVAGASERYRPIAQISLANTYIERGDAAQARALYEQIQLPAGPLLPLFQRGLGNLLLAEAKPAEALQAFERAAQLASGNDAAYHRLWALDGIARSQLALGDAAAARARFIEAAQLADGIRARFRSEEFKAGLFGDVQKIFERAIGLLADSGDHAAAWRLSEQSRARALLDLMRERVAPADAAQAAALKLQPTLAAVQAALRPGETLLQYHSLDERLLAWTISRDGIDGRSLPLSRSALAGAVDKFRQAMRNLRANPTEQAAALYGQLIAPLPIAADARLVIVPHGPMHYLPFQALRDGDAWLIERHALALAPSASVAMQLGLRDAAPAGAATAVLFGNPTNPAGEDLPSAEREVQTIGKLFSGAQVFTRQQATKARFEQSAGGSRSATGGSHIVHVAAHAEVDRLDPLSSRLLFAADGADPGFLLAREVYGIDMSGVALVTLSACASGYGRIDRGDEMLGFTRSFLSAGASSLLVSLWPVDDDSTALMMGTFYDRLAQGEPAIAAMRAAQLAALKTPRFSHPFFWAPFNLMGDWRMTLGRAGAAA